MALMTALEPDPFVEIAEQADLAAEVTREQIARLAYEKWRRRGQPEGSAEQDWLEAERELRPRPTDPKYTAALARAEWLAREYVDCLDAE